MTIRFREPARTPSRPPARRRTRPVRGSARSGAATREHVLLAARKILIREGHARFSIRRVADVAGISVGNLTYHFSSKRRLLRILIESLVAEHRVGIERFHENLSAGSESSFAKLVEWRMREAASVNTSRIFRELWSMALHDATVARAIDDFYDVSIDKVVALLREAHPGLQARDALELVHLLALVSEGTNVIYGTRFNRRVSFDRLAEVACATLVEGLARASGRLSRPTLPEASRLIDGERQVRRRDRRGRG
jgi:AcrR family transcriptional regulator